MGMGRVRIYPRECVDEVFRVLSTSKKIWIPFILVGLIGALFLSIDHVFRAYFYKDLITEPSGIWLIQAYSLGSQLLESFLRLLLVPSILLMYRSLARRRMPSFRRSFTRGLRYYPRLVLAYLLVLVISLIVGLVILNTGQIAILNILRTNMGMDQFETLVKTGILFIASSIISIFYGVLFLLVNQSIVLGKKGVVKGIEESLRAGIKNYMSLFALLFFFTMFPFLLRYIINILEVFHGDLSYVILAIKVSMIPIVAVLGIFSTLVYTSFYLRYKKMERSGPR